MALLIKKLNEHQHVDHLLCITSQHREMLDQVLSFFDIQADFDFNIMKTNQDLTDVTCGVLKGFRDLFCSVHPDVILVHGDTTTCMSAGLAAFYAGIGIAHVEAGLRTGNMRSPFPEEANRSIIGRLATTHFAPTERNRQNLIKEGINDNIFVTGNTVIDSLLFTGKKVNGFSEKVKDNKLPLIFGGGAKIILITGHRRENFGNGFIEICTAIANLAKRYHSIEFVYPVHLNPKVGDPVHAYLGDLDNVHLIAPLDYPDFVYAMKQSYIILTDSGGVQEEAPSLGKPVLVMRDTTERPEAVEAGTVKLTGANAKNIETEVSRLLESPGVYAKMCKAHNPYGDGKAVSRIVEQLTN